MRFLRRSLIGVMLLSITLGLLAFAGQTIHGAVETASNQESRSRPARERVFAANVVAFEPGQITPELRTFGEVRARRTLELRATASGTIVELHPAFEEGGKVAAGDLLLRVDPSDAQSALDVAVTDLAEAEAEVRDAATGLDLAIQDAAAAEEQMALRVQALLRAEQLLERRIGSEAAVESAALAEASAKQTVVGREQALAQARARVDLAATSLARRKIALAEAERRLAETTLHAEFSGTLSNVSVVKGGLVQNNERLAELVDPGELEVSFRVSNDEYARLLDEAGALTGSEVTVSLGDSITVTGRLSRDSALVGEGQTGRLLFAILNAPRGLRPGDFVTVSVAEPPLQWVAALPATAVDAAGQVLVIGAEDRLEVAEVRVLRQQGDDVLVRSRDLRGREVVAERNPLLGAGIKIRPLRQGDSTEPEAPAMVALTEERRAKLVAFVEGNTRMPAAAKERVLSQLQQPEVPAQMVERLESRMGG